MSFPPHMPIIPPMPFFPPGAPMMMPPNMATPPPPINGALKPGEIEKKKGLQNPTTVFVGSISDRAPDTMIKRMLSNCGSVVNWKRVQGANGKLQAFGFCEYENPEGTLRCIRLLNGWQIQDKKLVVKVDTKTKTILDEYKKKKRHELAKKAANDTTAFKFVYEEDDEEGDDDTKKSSDADSKKKSGEEGEIEEEEEHDYIDNETRREDAAIKQSLETIMREYSKEMNQRALEAKEQAMREAQLAVSDSPISDSSPLPSSRRLDPAAALEDEESKRNLITNEIQMFRDRFKDEETKMRNTEKERKDRYERERVLQREKRVTEEIGKDKSPVSSPSSRPSSSRRDRSSPTDDRHRSSSSRNNTSNSVRSRTNDRRSPPPPPPSRYDRRSPRPYNRRSRTKSPPARHYSNDADDEETMERKREERRLRDKENRYRERLKAWEQRERKKKSDYELEKRRELTRLHDEEKEGKRLLAFLDDYHDENDDPKYYKGTSLSRRLKDREHEIELDNRDRRYEKDEIEELRQKLLLQPDIDDIEIEIKTRLEKQEESIRKRLADLIRSTSEEPSDQSDNEDKRTNQRKDLSKQSINPPQLEINQSSIQSIPSPPTEPKVSPRQTSALGGAPITGTKILSKRKLAVNEVFRDDQDDENTTLFQKKSKLTAIPELQPTPAIPPPPPPSVQMKAEGNTRTSSAPMTPTNNSNSAQIQEEKRLAVRKLIESIPTRKEDLFNYPLDWALLDTNLIEKRIKPWVIKKIVEYLGEEEATLTDFICSSILSKKTAESILSDIRVVLDDEAEVFVVKMWRLIVYEIEAKRNGLSK